MASGSVAAVSYDDDGVLDLLHRITQCQPATNNDNTRTVRVKKITPYRSGNISQWLRISKQNFTRLLHVRIYAKYEILYNQAYTTKLRHIKLEITE